MNNPDRYVTEDFTYKMVNPLAAPSRSQQLASDILIWTLAICLSILAIGGVVWLLLLTFGG